MSSDQPRDFAAEYARTYEIEAQQENEEGWSFRLRVAKSLRARGQRLAAQEVFENRRSDEHGALGTAAWLVSTYSEEELIDLAQCTEKAYQSELRAYRRGITQRKPRQRAGFIRRWFSWHFGQ
jgi:hypothetical protein